MLHSEVELEVAYELSFRLHYLDYQILLLLTPDRRREKDVMHHSQFNVGLYACNILEEQLGVCTSCTTASL